MIALKHEADVFAIQFGALLAVQFVDQLVSEDVLSGPAIIQHAHDAQQRGFPAPEGPMMVTNSPSLMSRLMRRSSHTVPAGLLMVFSMLRS